MSTVFVKPITGALVRMPGTMSPLPAAGAEISLDGEDGRFWRRRLLDGSVVIEDRTPAPASPSVSTAVEEVPIESESARSDKQRGGRGR